MPGKLIAKVAAGEHGMWSRVEFPNGDQVMVSMAAGEVKVLRMRGTVPVETLATVSPGGAAIAWGLDYDEALRKGGPVGLSAAILDAFTEKVLDCSSARGVEDAFQDLSANAGDEREA